MSSTQGGCGGGCNCTCGGGGGGKADTTPAASINGIALYEPGQRPDDATLRERAWGELLRQEAVRQGLLPRHLDLLAPELSAGDQHTIATMLEREVPTTQPDEQECRRYYEGRKSHYTDGRQVRARHILFAVTEGIDIHKLAVRAEEALLELTRKDCPPERFAQLARELSNCPSGAEGGDLGWIAPDDCVDELANELFHQIEPLHGIGLRPRLVHSRYGFHIVEVMGRKQGRQLPFEEVRERIAVQLAQQSRAKALHQYIQLLAGRSVVEGVQLAAADSPLVQ
jgi:peptidyl-prolyl cis-trans isomerase C